MWTPSLPTPTTHTVFDISSHSIDALAEISSPLSYFCHSVSVHFIDVGCPASQLLNPALSLKILQTQMLGSIVYLHFTGSPPNAPGAAFPGGGGKAGPSGAVEGALDWDAGA